jgi:hypothetical protein
VVSAFFSQKEVIAELVAKNTLTLETLSSKYNITSDCLEAYYKFSKVCIICIDVVSVVSQYNCAYYCDT